MVGGWESVRYVYGMIGEEEEPGSSQGRLVTLPDGSPHGLGSLKRGQVRSNKTISGVQKHCSRAAIILCTHLGASLSIAYPFCISSIEAGGHVDVSSCLRDPLFSYTSPCVGFDVL